MSHSIDKAAGVLLSQCIQDSINSLTVNIITDNSYNMASESALLEGLRKRVGSAMHITIRTVDQLEKNPSGKTPFIVSRIGHKFT